MERPIVIVGASLAGLRARAGRSAPAGHDGRVVVVGAEEQLPYTRRRSPRSCSPASRSRRCALPGEKSTSSGGSARRDGARPRAPEVEARRATRPRAALAGEAAAASGSATTSCSSPRARGRGSGRAARSSSTASSCCATSTTRSRCARRSSRAAARGRRRRLHRLRGRRDRAQARPRRHADRHRRPADDRARPGRRRALRRHCTAPRRRPAARRGRRRVRGRRPLEAVRLADGTRVEADLAVVALGAIPNTDWLAGSGLELEPGVVCDATLAGARRPGRVRAGDVALAAPDGRRRR